MGGIINFTASMKNVCCERDKYHAWLAELYTANNISAMIIFANIRHKTTTENNSKFKVCNTV